VTAKEILAALEKDGLGAGLTLFEGAKDAAIVIPRDRLHAVARHLRDARHLAFDLLVLVTGTHMIEKKDAKGVVLREPHFEVIYHVRSIKHRALVAFKVKLPIDDPTVDTVSDVWAAANWHERETWDLVGIRFRGHPDLRRILLPEDWEGHPLRKDYAYPKAYRDINLEVDAPWPIP
jgi:NADH-quinone oxidoreductase subunit C